MMMKKEDVDALLERRKELKEQINKLNKEYTAIGNLLHELRRYEEKENER